MTHVRVVSLQPGVLLKKPGGQKSQSSSVAAPVMFLKPPGRWEEGAVLGFGVQGLGFRVLGFEV